MGGLKPREQAFLQALAVRRRRFAADAGARPRPGIPSQQRKVMTEQEAGACLDQICSKVFPSTAAPRPASHAPPAPVSRGLVRAQAIRPS